MVALTRQRRLRTLLLFGGGAALIGAILLATTSLDGLLQTWQFTSARYRPREGKLLAVLGDFWTEGPSKTLWLGLLVFLGWRCT